MVYGIVQQSGGEIEIESVAGRGTAFRIYLPPAKQAPEPAPAPASAALPRGTERILLVEDEDGVRGLCALILGNLGYEIIQAANPLEAESVFDRLRAGPDLLLSDIVMPGGDGCALAATLTARLPALRVVLMSGYAEDAKVREALETSAWSFLRKPFSPQALAQAVRRALDEEPE